LAFATSRLALAALTLVVFGAYDSYPLIFTLQNLNRAKNKKSASDDLPQDS